MLFGRVLDCVCTNTSYHSYYTSGIQGIGNNSGALNTRNLSTSIEEYWHWYH